MNMNFLLLGYKTTLFILLKLIMILRILVMILDERIMMQWGVCLCPCKEKRNLTSKEVVLRLS